MFHLSYDLDSWHHGFTAQAIGANSNNVTTAERYQAGVKSKYDFTEHDYVFGLVNWEKDRFGGYESQLSEAVGYGRRLLNSDTQILNLEMGIGAKQADLSDGSKLSGIIGRAGIDYQWKFSESADFSQLLAVESWFRQYLYRIDFSGYRKTDGLAEPGRELHDQEQQRCAGGQ